MIPYYTEAAQKRMKAGKKTDPKANLTEGETGAVRELVAKLMNVSSGSVGNAARLLKQGCPELIQQVERGEISVSAATDVSGLPKDQQKKIAEGGKKSIKAKEIRVSRKPSQEALDDAETENKDPRDETTSEITKGPSNVGHITPTLQIAADKPGEAQRGTEKPQEISDPSDWIIRAISSFDVTDITWVLWGHGNPPAVVNEGVHLIVRPDTAEQQPMSEQTAKKAPVQSEEKPTKHLKKCFGTYPPYRDARPEEDLIPEDCKTCSDSGSCAIAFGGQKECFGKHPEGISRACMLCSHEAECETATHGHAQAENAAREPKGGLKKRKEPEWIARLYASVNGHIEYVATLDKIPETAEAWGLVRSAFWMQDYKRLFLRDNQGHVRWDTGKVG